mmetsp:Transcript_68540/g.164614  ORF Transcript_68540/g.164614 Transcript_68540/m.164614 type:complete len:231 (+) Transcript_68540:234-926(+)
MKLKYQSWSKEPLKKLQLKLASSRHGPASFVNAKSQPDSGTSGHSFSCASMHVCSLAVKSGILTPVKHFLLSGWCVKPGGGRQEEVSMFCTPTLYQCAFERPSRISPVATSTLNMTELWSVLALALPALRTHDNTLTPFSPSRPPLDAVITLMVESGAFSGSKEVRKSSLLRAFCRIQSPPDAAFLKKWIARPPSSFLCFATTTGSFKKGATATPRSSPTCMKVHLFSMA